ncbi:MAG TPA: sialidase family protein, partial [Chitinophagales bacterium]|nr:sialidase family protein [Chitinophagales bacterium]
MKKRILLPLLLISSSVAFSQTIIGNTSYDVQTNNAAKHRISVYDDGSISAAWTGSTDYAVGTTNPDRGMFFNHYNGATWGAFPATRVETTKTGFGEVITVLDHEVTLAHDGAALSIQLYANSSIGGTTWTELTGSDDVTGFWPAAVCPEGTNDIYMVNANANPPTELRFSRSDDGGLTWSVLNSTVPFLTAAEGIPGLGVGLVAAAETYQIAVSGTNVYILYGVPNSDLVLISSNANGAVGTWTSTVLHNFPIDNYNGLTQTDVDG